MDEQNFTNNEQNINAQPNVATPQPEPIVQNANVSNQGFAAAPAQPQTNGMAIAGLVLGIASIVFCWVYWLGLVVGVLGLIFSILGRKKDPKNGMAIGGLVTSIIGLVISAIITIIMVAACATACSFGNSLLYY